MIATPELRTERLLLRAFRRQDIPDIVRLAGAREVAATTLRIPHPYTEADAHRFLDTLQTGPANELGAVFAITLLDTGELCGAVGLHPDPVHPRAELGYWIGVPYWGRGYATEAARAVLAYGFDVLKLHRIWANHFKDNAPSGLVLRKLGMRYEGCSREHIEKWGRFIDLENYAILASEWR
ncbi:MAG: GNAT family N-acetyltransferase [Acidobacteriia bacterium]|nr:GNAT family N-acetyltransferase [Terriglobia bacterium]